MYPKTIKKHGFDCIEDWGSRTDYLDGEEIKTGWNVKVTFPDGAEFDGVTGVDVTTREESCHNDRWTSKSKRAWVAIQNFHGARLKLFMREHTDLKYSRIRVSDGQKEDYYY